jgi:hypothetical protein
MRDPFLRALQTVRFSLVALLAWALVSALPLTGSSVLAASEMAAISLIVLALASTPVSAPFLMLALPDQVNGFPVTNEAGSRVLRTRPTDPMHHPLAPRAPGLA